ncbi:MAG TPA: hypothetical protein VG013_22455 [Gemmataceae bacterium]|nr:hypothetical protein [Gemmataceae bacterium]
MTPEERLAWIVSALESVGLACLVMGGHAVRYYGLQRYTNDFDLTLARDGWDDLADRLARTGLFSGGELVEGNSWRPGAFRRFQLGTLADGQEEWLEFWRENHLLDPFPDLFARREVGAYGTREVPFLALPDLLRSKETERAKDWDDVSYLEEFLDARLHARCVAGAVALADALAGLRSRRGFDTYLAEGSFDDRQAVKTALGRAVNPIAQAFLLPYAPGAATPSPVVAIEPLVERKLRAVVPASPLHRSLVEVVRRKYKVFCQARDRADKEAIRAARQPRRP